MFLSIAHIEQSLRYLKDVHPIFLVTFLACKRDRLPVGGYTVYHISESERKILNQYYRPTRTSKHFCQISDSGPKDWVDSKYPTSTLQGMRTRGDLSRAFIHTRKTQRWGFSNRYLEVFKEQLLDDGLIGIPAYHLATWLFRERDWEAITTARMMLITFLEEFNITLEEKNGLFDLTTPGKEDAFLDLAEEQITWSELQKLVGVPPDIQALESGLLTYFQMKGIGPVNITEFSPTGRLNLITGDNGLGKTFLLDCVWWALTENWANLPVYPHTRMRSRNDAAPRIVYQLSTDAGDSIQTKIEYNWLLQEWETPSHRASFSGIVLYAQVDGSFAVWDPILGISAEYGRRKYQCLRLTKDEIMDGSKEKIEGRSIHSFNGLFYDWILWQNTPQESPFGTLKKVLRRLSPPTSEHGDLGPLEPGSPTRIPGGESRLIPTIRHAYGEEPIIYASAAVRRIVSLAYLVVWTWEEHKVQSSIRGEEPLRKMVILIDEIESHLHPRWQRVLLPAMLAVREDLDTDLQAQLFVTTHSPLVLASAEPTFSEHTDSLFQFEISEDNEIEFQKVTWTKQGDAVSWLTSETFGLAQARSREAEIAIEAAESFMRNDSMSKYPKDLRTKEEIHGRLAAVLPDHDQFWPRWIIAREKSEKEGE